MTSTSLFEDPIYLAVFAALKGAWMTLVWVHVFKSLLVRKSEARYRWATAERTLLYPALAFPVLATARYLTVDPNVVRVVLSLALLAFWAWMRKRVTDADEDNYWSGRGRRLSRAVRTALRHLGSRSRTAAAGA